MKSRRMQVFSNGDTIQENVTYGSRKRIRNYRIRWHGTINSGTPNSFVFAKVEENAYFGSKPLKLWSVTARETYLTVDRLGSIRRSNKDYFPYGQEAPTTTAGDKERYATYKHDAATDLSYADQRYYATGAGRFMTADRSPCPTRAATRGPNPTAHNQYSYVWGDPVNFYDPSGLCGQSLEALPEQTGPSPQSGGSDFRGPEGTGSWETEEGRFANVKLLEALAAAAARAATQDLEPDLSYVAYLQLTNDSITMKNPKTGRPSRDRTYQAIDQYGNPMRATVTERVLGPSGNPVNVQDPLSSSSTIPTPVRTLQGTFMAFSMVLSTSTSLGGQLFNDVTYNGDAGMWNSDGSPRLPLCDQ